MSSQLRSLLARHTIDTPGATLPLLELLRLIRHDMPTTTRQTLIAELQAAGYAVGKVGRVNHVAGLARRNGFVVRDGHLVSG